MSQLFWVVIVAVVALGLVDLARRHRRRLRLSSSKVKVAVTGSVRRGEDVPLTITIRDGAHTGLRLRVGIVCVERYDVEESTETDTGGQSSRRVTREDLAHEEWREVSASEAQQSLSFVVPAEGPYSYRGSCLSFEWHAEALEIARLRPDAVASATFEVRP
jgi:hypothetical protein